MSVFSIAVDLGGTNLRIAAVSDDGKMLEKVTTGTEVQKGRDHVIREMCDAIQSLTTKHQSSGKLVGIGIGVPGFIDMDTGIIMRSPNLQDWAGFPVRQEIEKRLNTKVVLENDANAAAMGEKWLGAGRNTDHMAMYTLGTGVGGGIVVNGRLWHGINGMAGELGHFNIESEGHPCGCGSRGCLEQYASATAIVRMAHEAIDGGNAPDLADFARGNVEFTSRSIYQLAHPGASVGAEDLSARRPRAGDRHRLHGQRAQSSHVRDRRRRLERLGRIRSHDVRRVKGAVIHLLDYRAGPRAARTEAHGRDDRFDGQRCRPVRCGASADAA